MAGNALHRAGSCEESLICIQLVRMQGHCRKGTVTFIISKWVTLNSGADSSNRVARTAFMEWLCKTAPAPRSSYACSARPLSACTCEYPNRHAVARQVSWL